MVWIALLAVLILLLRFAVDRTTRRNIAFLVAVAIVLVGMLYLTLRSAIR